MSNFKYAIAPFFPGDVNRLDLFVSLFETLRKRDISKLSKGFDNITLNPTDSYISNDDSDAEEDEPANKKSK